METVISANEMQGHIINKYAFKVLPTGGSPISQSEATFEKSFKSEQTEQKKDIAPAQTLENDAPIMEANSKDELIESLLKKTDEMSSNFIKLQMKLESKEEEYLAQLQENKIASFEEGKVAGASEAKEIAQKEHQNAMEMFAQAVKTLDESANTFKTSIHGIEKELIHAALDIAKEVIIKEQESSSSEIATLLANNLIKEIETSSQVTLRVNPHDKVELEKSMVGMTNIEVVSDNAVSLGGVIVISDAGNIDGDIMKRYENVKASALGK